MSTETCSIKNSEVECFPIKTIQEVLKWKPTSLKHYTEFIRDRVFDKEKPRTLVCHDMKGGYLEDRFLNGSCDENCYNFLHWSMVDIFVYFSHHLVTIPPCGWITAAHKNGTAILGTFITEWEEGVKTCEMILKDNVCVNEVCHQLVAIASFYGFDGWLINIENMIEVQHIQRLKEFVASLTNMMHRAIPHSIVIWYDSVIETGELKWQDSLNEHNRDFFLACDGIFLNYGWKEQNLQETVFAAGSRIKDVYVGVDVFGRNEMGKVGFDVHYPIKLARDHGLSVAIFAPGWVYEALGPENFWENQHRFWESLKGLCFSHGYKSLPFSSTFCPGQGRKMYRKGKIIGNATWFNLSLQEPQISCHHDVEFSGGCTEICLEDAYSGGGCLKLTGILDSKGSKTFRIFLTHFEIKEVCDISFTFKRMSSQTTNLVLVLGMLSSDGAYDLYLAPEVETENGDQTSYVILNKIFADKINIQEGIKHPKALLMKAKSPIIKFKQSVCEFENFTQSLHDGGWCTRRYSLNKDFNNHIITSINACIFDVSSAAGQQHSALLGEVRVSPKEERKAFFTYKDFKLTMENNQRFLQCVLEWSFKRDICSWDIFFKFNNKYEYIGTTSQTSYKISDLALKPEDSDSSENQSECQIEFFLNAQSLYTDVITESLKINFV